MATIRHIAIRTPDPDALAKFYCEVFGMHVREDYPAVPGTARAIFVSDGYMEVALIEAKERLGVDHFGFTLDASERPEIYRKLKQFSVDPHAANPDRPYIEDIMIDIDGNKVDLSTTGLRSHK